MSTPELPEEASDELPREPRYSALHHLRERRMVTADAMVEYLRPKLGTAGAIGEILMHNVRKRFKLIERHGEEPMQIVLPDARQSDDVILLSEDPELTQQSS